MIMNKKYIMKYIVLVVLICSTTLPYPQKMIINSPVANLRFEPISIDAELKLPTSDLTNPLQITQLLMGEYIIANYEYTDENNQEWLFVNAVQQQRFLTPMGWHGYQGWVEKKYATAATEFPPCNAVVKNQLAPIFDCNGEKLFDLSMGTRIQATPFNNFTWEIILPTNQKAYINNADIYIIEPEITLSIDQLRQNIITTAQTFLGSLYSWGGRSAQNPEIAISSVDCSALLNLSFLAHGLQIPRMSREQFLSIIEIDHGSQLQPGDFVFFASIKKHPFQIDHVMMVIDQDTLLETTFEDQHVARIISFTNRIGTESKNLQSGDIIEANDDQYNVYLGTYFTTENLDLLRKNALLSQYLD